MCLVLLKTGGYAAETPLQKVTNHKQGSESVNFTHVNFLVSLFAQAFHGFKTLSFFFFNRLASLEGR